MKQFLESHKLPNFTQGDGNNLHSPVIIKEIKSIINNVPKKKAPGPNILLGNCNKHLRKKNTNFSQSFQKLKQRANFPDASHYSKNKIR